VSVTAAKVSPALTVSSIIEKLPVSKAHIFIVMACGFGYMFDSFDTYIISFAMPAMVKDWHITPVMMGMLTSSSMWGTLLGAIIWGPLTDKFGRKFGFVGTVLGFSLVSGFTALSTRVTPFMVYRFITGMCLGGMIPVVSTLVAEYISVKHRGRYVAVITIMWPIGLLIAASCALVMVPRFGWRVLFVLGALPAFLAFVVIKTLPESPRWLATKGKTDKAITVLKRLGATDTQLRDLEPEEVSENVPFTVLLHKPYLKRIIATSGAYFFSYYGYFGYILWFPSFLATVYKLSLATTFKYSVFVGLSSILGKLSAFYTIEKFGRKQLFYVGYGLGGIVGLFFGLIKNPVYILPGACLIGYLLEYGVAGNVVWTPELYPSKIRSTANCFSVAWGKVSGALSPLAFGYFISRHWYYGVWVTMAICFAITILIVATMGIETKGKTLEEIGAA
jgi:putative MFS transporter